MKGGVMDMLRGGVWIHGVVLFHIYYALLHPVLPPLSLLTPYPPSPYCIAFSLSYFHSPPPPPPPPSSVDYNLDQAESDELLLELLEEHDDMEVDQENLRSRSENRHPSLFGLYPLPNREDAKENRLPAPPPAEAQGLKLHVKVSELRYFQFQNQFRYSGTVNFKINLGTQVLSISKSI